MLGSLNFSILSKINPKIYTQFLGTSRVYIDAPPEYRGKTKGLCGTFSSNIQDDFLTPEGDIESSVTSFANKWRTKETCQYVSDGFVPHPCHLNMENKEVAINTCNMLKEKVFDECHWSVDVSFFVYFILLCVSISLTELKI